MRTAGCKARALLPCGLGEWITRLLCRRLRCISKSGTLARNGSETALLPSRVCKRALLLLLRLLCTAEWLGRLPKSCWLCRLSKTG